MQPQPPCLAIDYGAACTRAVLVWADGAWTALGFDGGFELSSAAHVGTGEVLVGAAAWRQASLDPDGFVVSPLRAGIGQVTAAGIEVKVADIVAATLRRVAAEAARTAGTTVADVRIVVPAGWGPRRRTWLRHAARTAGLGQPRLVEAPVAAAARLTSDTDVSGPAVILVIDVGAGCEVTVVRRGPAGFDVLSTLADPAAGGDRIDTLLATSVTGIDPQDLPGERRWPLLANVRTAKQALSEQIAVTMPMPAGEPPMIVNTTLLNQAAQPVLERVGGLAAEAIANADLTGADINAVHTIGASTQIPGCAQVIAAKLGALPQPAELPAFTAVLGAADAHPITAGEPTVAAAAGFPPLRRLLGLALPGIASLLLYGHFVFSAEFYNTAPAQRQYYYVLATWGELAMASILALVAALEAGTLFAAVLDQQNPTGPSRPGAVDSRILGGIGLAVAAGLSAAALYAVTAAVFFDRPIDLLLRWALLPILPTTVCAVALIAVAWHRRTTPSGGWDAFLAFPASSVIAATAGIFVVALWWQGHLPAWLTGWRGQLGYLGAVLVGVGIACTVVHHLIARIVLSLLLGFFGAIISRSGPDILAIIYTIATAAWWGHRVWTLARTPHPERAARLPAAT
jgi:hypothetical protein